MWPINMKNQAGGIRTYSMGLSPLKKQILIQLMFCNTNFVFNTCATVISTEAPHQSPLSSLKARFLSSVVHLFTYISLYACLCFAQLDSLGLAQVISTPSLRHEFVPKASGNHFASLNQTHDRYALMLSSAKTLTFCSFC